MTVDAELWVAPEAWDTAARRLAEIAADLHDAARPPHTPGTVPVGVSLMAFPLREAPPGSGPAS